MTPGPLRRPGVFIITGGDVYNSSAIGQHEERKNTMKRLISAFIIVSILAIGLVTVASADPKKDPPGQGPCSHGYTGKPCKEDPQPDKGKDCEEHGPKEGGVNEDHCSPSTPTTPVTTPVTTPTVPTVTTTVTVPTVVTTPEVTTTPDVPEVIIIVPDVEVIVVPVPQIVTVPAPVVAPPVVVIPAPAPAAPPRVVAPPVVPAQPFSPPRAGDGGLLGQ